MRSNTDEGGESNCGFGAYLQAATLQFISLSVFNSFEGWKDGSVLSLALDSDLLLLPHHAPQRWETQCPEPTPFPS